MLIFGTEKPINIIRYIISIGCLLVMFLNLFDCMMESKGFIDYLLNVILFLTIFMILTFSNNRIFISIILIIVGSFTLIGNSNIDNISYGVVYYMFSSYLVRNIILRIISYSVTLIVLICNSFIFNLNIPDFITLLMGYIIIYSLSEIVYLDIINRQRGSQ